MKRAIMLLIAVSAIVAVVFVACRGTATPTPTPTAPKTAADVPALNGLCRPDLPLSFGEPFGYKADGTPFSVAIDYAVMNCEEMRNYEAVLRTRFTQNGMEYSMFDSEFNPENQVAYLEDLAANPPDIVINHSVSEMASVPAIDKLSGMGVKVYNFDLPLFTPSVISYVHHWFEGSPDAGGGGICGQKWNEIQKATNQKMTILNIYCMRAALWSQARSAAVTEWVKDNPNITVIDSKDNGGSDEVASQIVIDTLTSNPAVNGIYMQCGGQAGVIAGLKAIDRLKPIGDPQHVTVVTFEGALPVMKEMKNGNIDFVMTHGPWDVCDVTTKVVMWNAVCGVDMPQDIVCPMFLLDKNNLDSTSNFMYGALYWTEMPPAQWDIWPVLDTVTKNTWGSKAGMEGPLAVRPANITGMYLGSYTPWGLRAPSLADRKANAKY
jgi:ABC-type sugar transport system substrate-binding protein